MRLESIQVKEVERLVTRDESRAHLYQRKLALGFKSVTAMARAMGISQQQLDDMMTGRLDKDGKVRPIGARQLLRLNAIDPPYELVEVVAVLKKKR